MLEQGKTEIVIPKTWRSELGRFLVFLVLSVAAVFGSRYFPRTVIHGPLFSVGDRMVMLSIPLLWFVPFGVLLSAIGRIYNVRYSIDQRGIESRTGIVSLNQSIVRIRFEDIRSIETEQSIMQRVLNIGLVEMGTAASQGLEMVFEGVGSPVEVQKMIQHERDERVRHNQERSLPSDRSSVVGNE